MQKLAHEVYVLEPDVIAHELQNDSPNPFAAYLGNEGQFFFWGLVSVIVLSTILCITLFRIYEKRSAKLLHSLKRYAPLVLRATVGLALIEFAWQGALFGPELPLSPVFGAAIPLVQLLFGVAGVAILIGRHVRLASVAAALIAVSVLFHFGPYVLSYVAYFTALLGVYLLAQRNTSPGLALGVVRAGFGLSVIAAALYAKFVHSNLALEVVTQYNLTHYFPFEPLFVVLGALIIESLIGLFLFFGIAIRWTTIFFLFWLTLSTLYFGEAIWPHLALFGLNITFFLHGYDKYSLEGWFFCRRGREPLL